MPAETADRYVPDISEATYETDSRHLVDLAGSPLRADTRANPQPSGDMTAWRPVLDGTEGR